MLLTEKQVSTDYLFPWNKCLYLMSHILFFKEAEIPLGFGMGADFLNTKQVKSNSFSTKWSYKTSTNAFRAGPNSDIFVVPNLNVMFEEVFIVEWDFDRCEPLLVERFDDVFKKTVEEFETSVVFNVRASSSQPALSFYSRYHLKNVKIPELNDAISAMDNTIARVEDAEIICCPKKAGSCLGVTLEDGEEYRQCGSDIPTDSGEPLDGAEDLAAAKEKKVTLETARNSWNDAIKNVDKAKADAIQKSTTITSWFDNSALSEVGYSSDININDEHKSKTALAPKERIGKSVILDEAGGLINVTDDKEGQEVIRRTKRIQFSGASGTFAMSLNQKAVSGFTRQNCDATAPLAVSGAIAGAGVLGLAVPNPALPIAAGVAVIGSAIAGCNYAIDLTGGIGKLSASFKAFGVGIGVDAGFGERSL